MDFLKEAKVAATKLTSLNKKIEEFISDKSGAAIDQLKKIYTDFSEKEKKSPLL